MEIEGPGGLTICIEVEEEDFNPRREFDNLGDMICFHKKYDLGDKHSYRSGDYASWDQVEVALMQGDKAAISLPLYLYDHSGLTINTTGFSCPWDSGQVGYIVVSGKRIRSEYGVKRITSALREKVTGVLMAEVEEYDQYIRGEVYYYLLKDEAGEVLDSCGGFIGYEHCKEEAEAQAEYFAAKLEAA